MQATQSINKSVASTGKAAEKSSKGLSQFASSLLRIAKYRILRTIIKEITQGFKEGLQNAYQFSKGIGGDLAKALDLLAMKSQTMKNQLGSAFGELIQNIMPLLQRFIAIVTAAADAIAKLLAVLGGRGSYLKAVDASKDWAENTKKGAGAAKEWKKQLMGFDEINRLNDNSGGGGGGGANGADASKMFVETPISSFLDQLRKDIASSSWDKVGKTIGEKINQLFPSKEKFSALGKKVGEGLKGVINTAYYTLTEMDFSMYGERIAAFINSGLERALSDGGGGSASYNLGALLTRRFTAALDFLIGFLGELDWGLVGQAIGDFFTGAFNEGAQWLQKQDWQQIGTELFNKFSDLIENIDFEALARSFFSFLGAAFRSVIGLLGGFFAGVWESVSEYFSQKTEECGGNAWKGFLKGIKDAVVGVLVWVRENVLKPFIEAFQNVLGIHSPSTVFEGIGRNVIEGFKQGISSAWESLKSWWQNNVGKYFTRDYWQEKFDNMFNIQMPHIPSPHFSIVYNPVDPNSYLWKILGVTSLPSIGIQWYAAGGFPEDGLFMANHGELVGQFSNGNTAVANNEQIIEGIKRGVYEAVTSAMGTSGGEQRVYVYLDGRQISSAVTKNQRSLERSTGVSFA